MGKASFGFAIATVVALSLAWSPAIARSRHKQPAAAAPVRADQTTTSADAIENSSAAQDAEPDSEAPKAVHEESRGPFGFLRRNFSHQESQSHSEANKEANKDDLTKASKGGVVPEEQAGWEPVIDPKGVNPTKYKHDLIDCRAYAAQVPGTNGAKEGARAARKWGAFDLLGTGVLAVATGGVSLLPTLAGAAAVSAGGTAYLAHDSAKDAADQKYRAAVGSCLVGRGYKVIG